MKQYRRIIRPTDPRVSIKLPKPLYQDLKKMASNNARRLSDEIVARLLATLDQCGTSLAASYLMQLIYDRNLTYKG